MVKFTSVWSYCYVDFLLYTICRHQFQQMQDLLNSSSVQTNHRSTTISLVSSIIHVADHVGLHGSNNMLSNCLHDILGHLGSVCLLGYDLLLWRGLNFFPPPLYYLGSALLHYTSGNEIFCDDELFFNKGYICHIISYLGKGKIILFLWFCKCFYMCVKTYWDFLGSNLNTMFVVYAIVKTSHDELSIVAIYLHVYNKLFTFISLHNNWIVSQSSFFCYW